MLSLNRKLFNTFLWKIFDTFVVCLHNSPIKSNPSADKPRHCIVISKSHWFLFEKILPMRFYRTLQLHREWEGPRGKSEPELAQLLGLIEESIQLESVLGF